MTSKVYAAGILFMQLYLNDLLITRKLGSKINLFLFVDNATEDGESDKECAPPFTLHIGMLYTAICRLVRDCYNIGIWHKQSLNLAPDSFCLITVVFLS